MKLNEHILGFRYAMPDAWSRDSVSIVSERVKQVEDFLQEVAVKFDCECDNGNCLGCKAKFILKNTCDLNM